MVLWSEDTSLKKLTLFTESPHYGQLWRWWKVADEWGKRSWRGACFVGHAAMRVWKIMMPEKRPCESPFEFNKMSLHRILAWRDVISFFGDTEILRKQTKLERLIALKVKDCGALLLIVPSRGELRSMLDMDHIFSAVTAEYPIRSWAESKLKTLVMFLAMCCIRKGSKKRPKFLQRKEKLFTLTCGGFCLLLQCWESAPPAAYLNEPNPNQTNNSIVATASVHLLSLWRFSHNLVKNLRAAWMETQLLRIFIDFVRTRATLRRLSRK